jgi:hypothetical protein
VLIIPSSWGSQLGGYLPTSAWHRDCGKPVLRGWVVSSPCVFISLSFFSQFWFYKLLFESIAFFWFSSLLPFLVIPWSLDHFVNILSTNETEGQQLLDLSKKMCVILHRLTTRVEKQT